MLIESQCNGLEIIANNSIDSKSDISMSINFIDIKEKDLWLKCIKNCNLKRKDNLNYINKNGYNIDESVKSILKIYERK